VTDQILLFASADSGYLYGLFFVITALIIGAATRHFMAKFPFPLPFTVVLMFIGLGLGWVNKQFLVDLVSHKDTHGAHAEAHDSHSVKHAEPEIVKGVVVRDDHFSNALVTSHLAAKRKANKPEHRTMRELTIVIGDSLMKNNQMQFVRDKVFVDQYKKLKSGYYAPVENLSAKKADSHHAEDAHGEQGGDGHHHMSLWAKFLDTVSGALLWGAHLDPHLLLYVFLPILIFEAAFAMDVHVFKKSFSNALIMAGPGIITAVLMTGGVLIMIIKGGIGLTEWNWSYLGDNKMIMLCMLFGVIVSATDPVAVVALLKELGASKKLGTLIEGESLLNDGTAIVLFLVIFAVVVGEMVFSPLGSLKDFAVIGLGGAALGGVMAITLMIWIKRVFNDPMVEITIIVMAAYLTFYVAEHFAGVSGVLALVSLGVFMAGFGRTRISPEVEHFLHEFWELAAFIANVLIFIIVGVVIAQRITPTWEDVGILLIIYATIHVVRAVNILVFYPLMAKLGYGLTVKDASVVWWGGLRGAIGLALALVVAGDTLHSGALNPIPQEIRDQFLIHISGIVFLTLVVNASTVKYLVQGLRLTEIPAVKKMIMHQAFSQIQKSGTQEMEVLKGDRFIGGANWSRVRGYLPRNSIDSISESELANVDTLAETRRRILEKERSSYWKQFKEGLLGAIAVQKLSNNVAELLDSNGSVPLTKRAYLEDLCGRSRLYEELAKVPVLGLLFRSFLEARLASSYDVAKGFVVSQEEVLKLLDSLAANLEPGEKTDQVVAKVRAEIQANRLLGLKYLRNMHEEFPEVTVGIETKQAIRTVLNFEKASIKKLLGSGAIESDEATRMIVDVDRRIEDVMSKPLELRLPTAVEVLKEAPWVKGLSKDIIDKIIAAAVQKNFGPGEFLMKQGDEGDGMVLITQGSANVMIGDTLVDILSRGAVIGEMSVLAGIPRTASVVAENSLTTLWLSSDSMNKIMGESHELATSLWMLAGRRFAENILSKNEDLADWSTFQLRRWLSTGNVVAPADGQTVSLYGKVVVLVAGSATPKDSSTEVHAPALLNTPEATFNNSARVFFCNPAK
jgi:NhaP-type Na+/H+ or K+/H+ antiporter